MCLAVSSGPKAADPDQHVIRVRMKTPHRTYCARLVALADGTIYMLASVGEE